MLANIGMKAIPVLKPFLCLIVAFVYTFGVFFGIIIM